MDLYRIVDCDGVDKEDPKIIKRKKKAIKKLQKSEYRRWSIKFLTNEVGRRLKRLLKYVIVEDSNIMISQRD